MGDEGYSDNNYTSEPTDYGGGGGGDTGGSNDMTTTYQETTTTYTENESTFSPHCDFNINIGPDYCMDRGGGWGMTTIAPYEQTTIVNTGYISPQYDVDIGPIGIIGGGIGAIPVRDECYITSGPSFGQFHNTYVQPTPVRYGDTTSEACVCIACVAAFFIAAVIVMIFMYKFL